MDDTIAFIAAGRSAGASAVALAAAKRAYAEAARAADVAMADYRATQVMSGGWKPAVLEAAARLAEARARRDQLASILHRLRAQREAAVSAGEVAG